jgi:ribonuclease-3
VICDRGSNVSLVRIGHEHGLDKFVQKNPCQGEDVSQTTMASTVEALLGAAWLDSGRNFEEVRAVMERLEIID